MSDKVFIAGNKNVLRFLLLTRKKSFAAAWWHMGSCKGLCMQSRTRKHICLTNCYYNGVDVKILSRLLGHADVNITYSIYVHLYGDGFDEMYAALTQ